MTFCRSSVAPEATDVPVALVPSALFAVTASVPAATLVVPEYVFATESLSVPEPSLVSVPLVVPITALIVVSPAPPTVSGCVAPVIPPVEIVSVPASELIRAPPDPSVIAPVQVLLLDRLRNAPPPLAPVPTRLVTGSAIVNPLPPMSSSAPEATVVPVPVPPNAALLAATSVPALIVVDPV